MTAPPHPEHTPCPFLSLPFAGAVPPPRRAPTLRPAPPSSPAAGQPTGSVTPGRRFPCCGPPGAPATRRRVPPHGGDPSGCLPIAGSRPGRFCPLCGSPAPWAVVQAPGLLLWALTAAPLCRPHSPDSRQLGPCPARTFCGAPSSFPSSPSSIVRPPPAPRDRGLGFPPSVATACPQHPPPRAGFGSHHAMLLPLWEGLSSAEVKGPRKGPGTRLTVGGPGGAIIKHPSLSSWEGASLEAEEVSGAGTWPDGAAPGTSCPASRGGLLPGPRHLPTRPGEVPVHPSQPALGGAAQDPHRAATPPYRPTRRFPGSCVGRCGPCACLVQRVYTEDVHRQDRLSPDP